METTNIEQFKVKEGEEVTPIIILTGTVAELEDFWALTGRNNKTAIPVRQGYQLPMYNDLAIALFGQFWLNSAYDSLEYKDRMLKIKLQELDK